MTTSANSALEGLSFLIFLSAFVTYALRHRLSSHGFDKECFVECCEKANETLLALLIRNNNRIQSYTQAIEFSLKEIPKARVARIIALYQIEMRQKKPHVLT
jgi:hypothetical protein